jgi:hypothetical protein
MGVEYLTANSKSSPEGIFNGKKQFSTENNFFTKNRNEMFNTKL